MKGQQVMPLSIVLQQQHKRLKIFEQVYRTALKSLRWKLSEVPQTWMKEKGLTQERTGAGFNSGQIHYGRTQDFKDDLKSIDFLRYSRRNSNGVDGYKTFG